MWDDFYGSMSPGEILGNLERLTKQVDKATTNTPVPPELEREMTALRKLHKRVKALNAAFDSGKRWQA